MENRRFHEIDLLKCVSILAVVYIHSISTSFYPTNFFGIFVSDFTRFAVPGLFFAAAFLFKKTDDVTTGQLIKKKLIRLLPPYLFCSLCIQFLNLPGLIVRIEDLQPGQFMFNLVFGGTLGIYYFVFVLLYLYMFSLILRKMPAAWVLVIWTLSFFMFVFFIKIIVPQGCSFFLLLRHPFFHLFSYLTGWIFSLYYEKVTSIVGRHTALCLSTFLIMDIIFLVFTRIPKGNFDVYPIMGQGHIYTIIALLLILGTRPTRFQAVVERLSNYSYGVYLLHFPIVRSCQLLYPEGAADYSFPYATISWAAGVSLSLLIILVIKKMTGRYSIYLVGC